MNQSVSIARIRTKVDFFKGEEQRWATVGNIFLFPKSNAISVKLTGFRFGTFTAFPTEGYDDSPIIEGFLCCNVGDKKEPIYQRVGYINTILSKDGYNIEKYWLKLQILPIVQRQYGDTKRRGLWLSVQYEEEE